MTCYTISSRAHPCSRERERAQISLRVPREALRKPCTKHERKCAQGSALSSSSARTSEISQVSLGPIKAASAKVIKLSFGSLADAACRRKRIPPDRRDKPIIQAFFRPDRTFPVLIHILPRTHANLSRPLKKWTVDSCPRINARAQGLSAGLRRAAGGRPLPGI